MPDISMCLDKKCPSANTCYRYIATPSKWQYYSIFGREKDQSQCGDFIPVEKPEA